MPAASIRFHGSLVWFLPPRSRDSATAVVDFESPRGVVDAVQACGVPHTEVDLILARGRPVGLDYRLAPDDRVEVFGLDRPVGLAGLPGLIPAPTSEPRFVLDGHLGRLARYLRLLGFDSHYGRDATDDELARISAGESRILLTRDRGLLKRSIVRLGHLVRVDDARRQLAEVVARYELAPLAKPFSRCVRCNGEIHAVPPADVAAELADQPRTLRFFDKFARCDGCRTVYWPGSHYDRMSLLVRDVLRSTPVSSVAIGENPPARS
jgi:uncharacterized protein